MVRRGYHFYIIPTEVFRSKWALYLQFTLTWFRENLHTYNTCAQCMFYVCMCVFKGIRVCMYG